jgi:hypothetical protein
MDDRAKERLRIRTKWHEALMCVGAAEAPEDDEAFKLHFAALVFKGCVTWAELESISYVRYGAVPEDWARPAWKSLHMTWLFAQLVNRFLDDHEPDFNRVVGALLAHLDTDRPAPIVRAIAEEANRRAHQALKLETH